VFPKKILITGATGLIGHTAWLHLHRQPGKYEVYALDRSRELSDRVPKDRVFDIPEERFFQCDLTDMEEIRQAVEGMEVVVHLAADPAGRGWESLLHNNLIGAYHVFEACRQAGVKRIVAASTIQVSFGNQAREPYRAVVEGRYQDVPPDFPKVKGAERPEPRNLYAASKVWTESLAQVYAHAHGMSCLCIRPGWVVAEDRPPRAEAAHIWCSQRDIARLIECCINAPEEARCEIFYGMSDNKWRWVDLEDARLKVGYVPQDRAEDRL